jgi:CopG family transcriptional regulator/antitoxin EndoAI
MPRTTATFSISVPPKMARELDRLRKTEHRTRSELFREALRQYMRTATVRDARARAERLSEVEPADDEITAIEAGRRDFASGRSETMQRVVARRRRR